LSHAIADPVGSNGSGAPPKRPSEMVVLPEFEVRTVHLRLRGTSPLICHKWSDKAKKMILDKQTKKAATGKEAKNPEQDYLDSLYVHPDGGYGFPTIAFKAAAVRAGTYAEQKMTFLRGAFHIDGELVKIEGEPQPREDMVRVGMGVADIRYRGEFPEWSTTLTIRYNARALSLEMLVNLFRIAGFAVGIGEWRPERDGQFGTFEVAA
jgi:hypothetical protein